LVAHLHFLPTHKPTLKNAKELPSQRTKTADNERTYHAEKKQRRHNSTYPKGGVSYSKDSFAVNGSLVFQIKFCGKIPALRVAANRYRSVSRPKIGLHK
jgi:hypothetical protein